MKVTKHVEQLLRQGRKPRELIELGFPKSVVTRVDRQLRREKTAARTKAPEGTVQAETRVEILPELPQKMAVVWQKLQFLANNPERIDSLVKAVSEVRDLIAATQHLGTSRREICPYKKDGLCTLETWSSEGEIPAGIGEPVLTGNEKPEWYIKPSSFYCAMCIASLESRLDDTEDKVSDDPLFGARYQITCKGCGSKGWIAVKIMCTKCKRETYWGWFPKE